MMIIFIRLLNNISLCIELIIVNSYQIFNMNSSQAQLAIVLEDAEHQLAFAIDRVEGFQFFDTSFESVSLKSKPAFHSFLSSSFCKDDQIYYLLNTQDLLRLSEQSFVLT